MKKLKLWFVKRKDTKLNYFNIVANYGESHKHYQIVKGAIAFFRKKHAKEYIDSFGKDNINYNEYYEIVPGYIEE